VDVVVSLAQDMALSGQVRGVPSSVKDGGLPDRLDTPALWSQSVFPVSELLIRITRHGGNSQRSHIPLFHTLTNVSSCGMLVSGKQFQQSRNIKQSACHC
jgi:hypothetical protein